MGAVSLPTCPGLPWTWRRDIYCSIISSTSPGNRVLSNVPHPVVCREWRKQITIKGRVSTSQLSVEPESLYLHYLLYIYTVSTQYLHTVGTLQFQNIAIGHTATLLPRPLPNFSQWTMKGRHRGQKLKYSKYDLLNVEMIECPRAAKTSPGTISFQWFIPEAVNMYSYSCLLIQLSQCHHYINILHLLPKIPNKRSQSFFITCSTFWLSWFVNNIIWWMPHSFIYQGL